MIEKGLEKTTKQILKENNQTEYFKRLKEVARNTVGHCKIYLFEDYDLEFKEKKFFTLEFMEKKKDRHGKMMYDLTFCSSSDDLEFVLKDLEDYLCVYLPLLS